MPVPPALVNSMKEVRKKQTTAVWAGPESESGGITQSLLGRFLVCRERFRLLVVEGLKPEATFSAPIEYGQMWHICEEEFATQADKWWDTAVDRLKEYCRQLCTAYPWNKEDIAKWYNICFIQFPIYVEYWKKNKQETNRRPIYQEKTFKVPYELPDGRVVFLRGKYDSVDTTVVQRRRGIYLGENKSKSQIDELKLNRQLSFDMQTMVYLSTLRMIDPDVVDPKLVRGVRYNVVRRPLSGGVGSIRKHKPTKKNPTGESDKEYYNRLRDVILENVDTFFARWTVEVSHQDIDRFQQTFLNPILMQLCDWWDWVKDKPASQVWEDNPGLHWIAPYGTYDILKEGGFSDVDGYVHGGSLVGLTRIDNLFPEL